ncbi:MAG TPA: UDP-N-acetylglucosamine 4,6-dehydratase, partial [Flavobacteriales bacterium]|nr:UDP-N-acetylglucosamine 4,6-dehydratase [Flavobacteriales bacterium]
RSEKDPYTLMRMIEVNILNTLKTIEQSKQCGVKKYFCVSTDKAANPVNMMGGSKRIMEMFLMRESQHIDISTARFANVAFSDGSLLHGFNQRLEKKQPIVAPSDVKRYFVVPQESGELCLLSSLLGENRDIFFPKLSEELHLITFAEIAEKFLHRKGFEPYLCENEDEARKLIKELPQKGKWPCLFTPSNTTGEKDFEEFFTPNEIIDLDRFQNLGIIKNGLADNSNKLDYFLDTIFEMRKRGKWAKEEIVELFHEIIPGFGHEEKGKYLDSKM